MVSKRWIELLCVALVAVPVAGFAPQAGADPVPAVPGFYQRPEPLPAGAPGDIVRSEPVALTLSLPAPGGPLPGTATRIMFHTTDARHEPTVASGLLLHPTAAWTGPGPQPLISYMVGTHGIGPQCAPSLQTPGFVQYTPPLDVLAEYELPFLFTLLAKGYEIVIPDHPGLGTPGTRSFLNGFAEAPLAMDAVRAAQRLGAGRVPPAGPVLFTGYSHGGHATAAIAEQLGDYAPELDVRGIGVGAPPAELRATIAKFDGTLLSGLSGYVLDSIRENYPAAAPELATLLNPAGLALAADVTDQCAAETVLRYGLRPTSEWTSSGQPLSRALNDNPVTREILDELALGQRAPSVPVLMVTGDNDDVVPAAGVRELAADWCAGGATVHLVDTGLPTVAPGSILGHGLNSLGTFFTTTLPWLSDRLAQRPAPSNCA
ncbi:lipase family protein [Nocardia asteroides]|uniref:lipase family protein n=1 Tax=Nocardia asteroides TaxID=1824 RepID=UPI001E3A5774|nr:lipase family protein [Nocardia asteroides]UGT57032.1 lipase family protein [Nocardia asteroides]